MGGTTTTSVTYTVTQCSGACHTPLPPPATLGPTISLGSSGATVNAFSPLAVSPVTGLLLGLESWKNASIADFQSSSASEFATKTLEGWPLAGAAIGGSIKLLKGLSVATKAVNLPAWRTIGIDMAHILERHTATSALSVNWTVFPEIMSEKGIERAIREAYRFGQRIGGEGDRILMQGHSGGLTIEMWVNRATRMIETAYPVVR